MKLIPIIIVVDVSEIWHYRLFNLIIISLWRKSLINMVISLTADSSLHLHASLLAESSHLFKETLWDRLGLLTSEFIYIALVIVSNQILRNHLYLMLLFINAFDIKCII